MRDVHQSRVYAAERVVYDALERGGQIEVAGSTLVLPVERRFGNLDNIKDYVERLHSLFGGGVPAPTVRPRKGQTRAHYETGANVIAVPLDGTWALREMVILHEYAHCLTRWRDRASGHGPEFQARYTDLVEEVIGPEAGFLLRYSLHQVV